MTEIAPGMMVECIDDRAKWFPNSANFAPPKLQLGAKYIVKSCNIHPQYNIATICLVGFPNFKDINYQNYSYHYGFHLDRFRPIGGDKEIEREESQRTGKSADGDARNGTDHPVRFFIIDMDDK